MNEERRNPFPGLRPFEYHEYELFFGREEQYEEMIAKLSDTHFLAVVGTSGSGKSSLVKAGLLPALYGGLMMSAGPSWRIAVFRPKDDPIRELALALNHNRVFGDRSKTNGSSDFKLSESTNWSNLCAKVAKEANEKERNPSGRVLELLSADKRNLVSGVTQDGDIKDRSKIVQAFNGILKRRDFYRVDDFRGVPFASEVRELLARDQDSLTEQEVQKLNRLLLEASFPQEIANKIESQAQITEVGLRRGDLGLIEVAREARMASDENLLVVVDQFEELFRYARISENGPHGNQAAAFVKLLLQASAQTDVPIYVVLTMRSDYLGDCSKFWGLPEAINKGQYLIPRLTRDQRREAIQGPIGLRGAKITPQLVNQLLNDMGDDPDQLPILQHALMRTWDQWEKTSSNDEPIDMSHYEAIGKMAEALSMHADEAYEELPDDRSREIAERIFRCLAERGTGHSEVRRPTSVSELLAITGATFKELNSVLNVFRKEGRSFLLPAARKPLRREALIDISHESLIRNWKKLRKWVNREADSANVYRRLVQTARLHEQNQAGTLTDLEVEYASRWKNENKPNLVWASRYHLSLPQDEATTTEATNGHQINTDQQIFEGAMNFLAESQEVSKRKARTRKLTKILVAAMVFLVVAIGGLMLQLSRQQKASQVQAGLTYSAEINLAQRELEAQNFAEVNRLLHDSEDVKQVTSLFNPLTWKLPLISPSENISLRDFEWHHLWKLSHDEQRTIAEQDSPFISVAYLNDSKTVAAVTRNGGVTLWDVGQRKVLARPQGAPSDIVAVAFSSDRKNIVIGRQDGSVGLWDLSGDLNSLTNSGQLRAPNRAAVNAIAYSPDKNALLALATQDGSVTMLRGTQPQGSYSVEPKPSTPLSLAFSSDGRSLAIGHDQYVTIIDPATRQPVLKIDFDKTLPPAMPVNPATAGPDQVGKARRSAPVTCLAFSPNGDTLAIGRKDNSTTLWDLTANRYMVSLIGHSLEVLAVGFSDSAKGLLASASRDGSIKIWDFKKLSDSGLRKGLNERDTGVGSEKEHLVSKYLLVRTFNGHAGAVTALTLIPNEDTIVSSSEDNTVKTWGMAVGPAYAPLQIYSETSVYSMAYSHDGKWLAAGNSDGSVVVWSTSDNEPTQLAPARSVTPIDMPIAFSKDQILAAATGQKSITLWQMNAPGNGERVLNEIRSVPILALAFSSDGKSLAIGGRDGTVSIFDVSTGKELSREQIVREDAVLTLAYSPAGSKENILAVGTSKPNVVLWNLDRNEPIRELTGHSAIISSVAFSPNGEILATGSWDRSIKLWDVHSGLELATLQGHSQRVYSIAFFPGGKRLVSGSEDRSIRLWDTRRETDGKKTRNALLTLRNSNSMATSAVATSPDGLKLAAGNADGTVIVRYGASDDDIKNQSIKK